MRIARLLLNETVSFGAVEVNPDGSTTIELLEDDPFASSARGTGTLISGADARLLAPVIPSKIIGVGDNYLADGEERGAFSDPLLFFKPSTSVCGPNDLIMRPEGGGPLAFEGELAVVMKGAERHLSAREAEAAIFGYTIANDVSAQGWQHNDRQWTRAKGSDTFCPLGPWIDTDLTLEQASDLSLRTWLSGNLVQASSTARLKRTIIDTIVHLSSFLTFLPGDVILSGTPAGAGPMADGDDVVVEIEGLGVLRNPTGS